MPRPLRPFPFASQWNYDVVADLAIWIYIMHVYLVQVYFRDQLYNIYVCVAGTQKDEDLYVRLIDSSTKQVKAKSQVAMQQLPHVTLCLKHLLTSHNNMAVILLCVPVTAYFLCICTRGDSLLTCATWQLASW